MSGEFPFRRFHQPCEGQELLPLNAKHVIRLYGFLNKEKERDPVFCFARSFSADSRSTAGQIHTNCPLKFQQVLLDIKTGKGNRAAQACLKIGSIINFRPIFDWRIEPMNHSQDLPNKPFWLTQKGANVLVSLPNLLLGRPLRSEDIGATISNTQIR